MHGKDLNQVVPHPASRQGMLGWLLQRLSAIIIFAILVTHIVVTHYTTPGEPITFAESIQRLDNPIFVVLWLLLLGAALYHILYGVRNIILDFVTITNKRTLTQALFGIGIIIFGVGVFFLVPLVIGKPLFSN